MDALTMKYRGGWPTTPETLEQPRSRGLDTVQTTGVKAACLHDATSAFDHEDNLDGQTRKYLIGQGCHLWKIF